MVLNTLNCGIVLISDIERGEALAVLVGARCSLAPNELNLVKALNEQGGGWAVCALLWLWLWLLLFGVGFCGVGLVFFVIW